MLLLGDVLAALAGHVLNRLRYALPAVSMRFEGDKQMQFWGLSDLFRRKLERRQRQVGRRRTPSPCRRGASWQG